jgi:hypothetical protein
MARETPGSCPICNHAASVTDWRPRLDWVAVEDCPCGGFFVWARLLELRLPRLSPTERVALAADIPRFRAMNKEAWLTTANEGVFGPVVILTQRPDRTTES